MEAAIIMIVLDGEATYKDSLGTKAVIRAGDVQPCGRREGHSGLATGGSLT
jgi:hypothetical protein